METPSRNLMMSYLYFVPKLKMNGHNNKLIGLLFHTFRFIKNSNSLNIINYKIKNKNKL